MVLLLVSFSTLAIAASPGPAWASPADALGSVAQDHSAPTAQRSLAPLDGELVRGTYGQQALFRLRLGADAGFDDRAAKPGCDGFQPDWSRSPQQSQLERALAAGQPYAAGLALGHWQRLAVACPSPGR